MAGLSQRFINMKFASSLMPMISNCIHSGSSKFVAPVYPCTRLLWARNLSSVNPEVPPAKTGNAASDVEKRDFLTVLPDIVQDLTNIGKHTELSDAQKWFAKVIQYNVIGGKLNRGLAVSLSLKEIMPKHEITPEIKRKAHILGWCIELFQSHFLVMDDIIDNSELRRGKPCWYRKEEVGLMAINDSLMLNGGVYKLLSIHFKDEPYYLDSLELFLDVYMKTTHGQCLDLQVSSISGQPNLKKFTMQHYDSIVKHKTSYYSFYLPVALAMYMLCIEQAIKKSILIPSGKYFTHEADQIEDTNGIAVYCTTFGSKYLAGIRNTDNARVAGITDRELHRQARTILLEMGSFFQVQDDYLDTFGNPLVTGKIGTDIAEGKCTWLAVVALQRASSSQRKVMEDNYGKNDKECVDRIRELYKELNLPATYKAYEESTSALIRTHIQQISRGLNHKVFFKFLEKIYKRTA